MEREFLRKAATLAAEAGHLWPEYAACEAALESGWGRSELTERANNLFGQKQSHPALAGTGTLELPTREFLHGAWVTVAARWAMFPDWASSFRARMERLHALAAAYPAYARALAAGTGEQFIREVSKSWSTDPERAIKVLAIRAQHRAAFTDDVAGLVHRS